MSETLKPCPFCGERAQLDSGDTLEMGGAAAIVTCAECSATAGDIHAPTRGQAEAEAAAAWNRRADDGYLRGLERAADLCDRSYGSDNKADRSPRHLARAIRAEIDRARREA